MPRCTGRSWLSRASALAAVLIYTSLSKCGAAPQELVPNLSSPEHWIETPSTKELPPEAVRVFVGIFTRVEPRPTGRSRALSGKGTPPPPPQSYASHREVIRRTYLSRLRSHSLVAARFIVGQPQSSSTAQTEGWQALAREAEEHGDVMQLPLEEATGGPSSAMALAFLAAAAARYPGVRWVVRVDDRALLLPQRLLMAADQWEAAGADYVGCMGYGKVRNKAHEPSSHILADEYPLHASSSVYALSSRAVKYIAANAAHLRLLGSAEGPTVGLWMLALQASHFDDRRMCASGCGNASVAVVLAGAGGGPAGGRGLGDVSKRLAALSSSMACKAGTVWPL